MSFLPIFSVSHLRALGNPTQDSQAGATCTRNPNWLAALCYLQEAGYKMCSSVTKKTPKKPKKDAKLVSWKRSVSNGQKHRGLREIKTEMAGPVFNVSTNKHGSNLCLRVWKPRLVELNGSLENNKKKEGYGCLDKNTLKCHHAHLECPALTGTSWLQLLAAPPPHPALPAQGAGPAAHQQEGGAGWGQGSGTLELPSARCAPSARDPWSFAEDRWREGRETLKPDSWDLNWPEHYRNPLLHTHKRTSLAPKAEEFNFTLSVHFFFFSLEKKL